jgi:uncharacterized protein (DUF305 family)
MTRTILRRATLTGGAVTAAFVLAACGSSSGEHSSMPEMGPATSGPVASASTATFNDADVMFTQMMIPHHQQAVEMANLAETRASDPQVKQLAEQIKAAQAPEIATMTNWLTAWGKPTAAPSGMPGMTTSAMPGMPGMTASAMPGMDHSHGGMPGMMSDADMAKLKAASGKDFDRQFCTMMIAHHQGAIEMAKQEQATGANPDAKALAGRIITAQQAEITTMNAILARL